MFELVGSCFLLYRDHVVFHELHCGGVSSLWRCVFTVEVCLYCGGVSSLEVCLYCGGVSSLWRCDFTVEVCLHCGGVTSLEVSLLLQGMACFYISF